MAVVTEHQLDLLAVRQGKRGWAIHAGVYLAVMIGLIILNLVLVSDSAVPHAGLVENTRADIVWFPFPLVGWGLGLGLHYVHGVHRAEKSIRARHARVEA